MKTDFINYWILDPRKPGKYSYEGLNFCFLFEPFYTGITIDLERRKLEHLVDARYYRGTNKLKNNIINKILNDVKEEPYFIISNIGNEGDSKLLEQKYIKIVARRDERSGPLANLTNGGEGIFNLSEESRKAISYKQKKNWECEEFKNKMREIFKISQSKRFKDINKKKEFLKIVTKALNEYWTEERRKEYAKLSLGENNNNFGNNWSEEQKRIASVRRKGKWAGDKNPKYKKGDSIKGDKNPFFDKKHTEKSLIKISKSKTKFIYIINDTYNGEKYTFEIAKDFLDFCKNIGINPQTFYRRIYGKSKKELIKSRWKIERVEK